MSAEEIEKEITRLYNERLRKKYVEVAPGVFVIPKMPRTKETLSEAIRFRVMIDQLRKLMK